MVLQIVRKKTDQVVCYSSVEVEETAVNSRLILSKRIRLIWCSEKISKLWIIRFEFIVEIFSLESINFLKYKINNSYLIGLLWVSNDIM